VHVDLPTGIRLEFLDTGPRRGPVLLLVMGLGMQLTAWPDSLVEGLVARGFRVLRFDNRDIGLSSRVRGDAHVDLRAEAMRAAFGLPVRAPYLIEDMAADTLGLMNELLVEQAHVIGVSMGGIIGQVLAAKAPRRVSSLVSVMSTSGAPSLRLHWSPATQAVMRQPPSKRAGEDAMVDHLEQIWQLIGSPSMKPPRAELRERLRTDVRRGHDSAGMVRQLLAVMASGDRRTMLRGIHVPTLVLHGEADPLVPIAAGRDTARHIPGAVFQSFAGMGHDLPEPLVPALVDAIADHCMRVQAAVG
jgi:pimeloyl-ACP methyl ester carboxylesterase